MAGPRPGSTAGPGRGRAGPCPLSGGWHVPAGRGWPWAVRDVAVPREAD